MTGGVKNELARVLVVDDNNLMRSTLRKALEEGGYIVEEAHSGHHGIQRVRESLPDILLLDIVMEGMDGFTTCSILRKLPFARHLPILMITALEDVETINRAYAVGATDYIVKPFNPQLLRHHIRYLLRANQVADSLSRNEERLAYAQRIARIGDWEWDGYADAIRFSEEGLRILGLPNGKEKVSFEAFLDRTHPEDRDAVKNSMRALAGGATSFKFDFRLMWPDGNIRTVHGQGEPVADGMNRVSHLAGTLQDITERKALEDKLLLTNKYFENSNEMILITDFQGHIVDINPAFCRQMGVTRKELIGRDLKTRGIIDQEGHQIRALWSLIQSAGKWQGELMCRRKTGEAFPALVSASCVRNNSEDGGFYLVTATDLTYLKETERRLLHLTNHDPLTNLPNRILFHDRLRQAIASAQRRGGMVAMLIIDIDCFREINDTFGDLAGDDVLRRVAGRVQPCVRKNDTLARIGGDEFALVLGDINQVEQCSLVATRIQEMLAKPFLLEKKEFYLTVSIGIALFPEDGTEAESLVSKAEAAMQFAKEQGTNTFKFSSDSINTRAQERLAMKTDLRHGLDRNEFFLHYQPKFDSHSGRMTGLEALARWQHPVRGLVPPLQFIPLAEETGLIVPLGERILQLACQQNKRWQETLPPFRVAVNLSAHQFRKKNLLEDVNRILEEADLDPECLEFEITESAIMQDVDRAIEIMKAFRQRGIRISLDDFGTGYSSLSYLRKFPVDALKIDRSFVRNIFSNAEDSAIVKAVIAMAHSLKLKVIAEGVENEEQRVFLREQGCDEVQGYLAGMPRSVKETELDLPHWLGFPRT